MINKVLNADARHIPLADQTVQCVRTAINAVKGQRFDVAIAHMIKRRATKRDFERTTKCALKEATERLDKFIASIEVQP